MACLMAARRLSLRYVSMSLHETKITSTAGMRNHATADAACRLSFKMRSSEERTICISKEADVARFPSGALRVSERKGESAAKVFWKLLRSNGEVLTELKQTTTVPSPSDDDDGGDEEADIEQQLSRT